MVAPFGRVCRACMAKEQSFHSILEYCDAAQLKIYEMLATSAPSLLIQEGDQLPELICTVCLNKLNIAFHFQQMCIATDKCLRAQLVLLKEPKPAPPEEEEEAIEQHDPLLEKTELLLENCLKMEFCDEFNLNALLVSTSPEETPQLPDALRNASESDESENSDANFKRPPSTLRRGRSKMQTSSTKSFSVHNETGLGEIEKPAERTRARGNFPCPDCGKVFDSPYCLRRHVGVHAAERPFHCEVCQYRFLTKHHLGYHKLNTCLIQAAKSRVQPTDGFKCLECPRRFVKRESLAAHMQSHRNVGPAGPFFCQHCPKQFKRITTLVKHAKTHAEGEQKCHLCSKSFPLNSMLIEHLNKHNGLKSFVCIYCNKSYQKNATLKEHIRTHTGDRPFLCPQCGKSFKNASNMRQHLLRHSGEKRYQCTECPSRFNCHSDRIKHMSTHRSIKPHVCDICGSRFSRSYTLNKHKTIHTGERPYKCEECNMTFVFVGSMRRHMRTHTGEKPYKCKFCARSYAESGDLTKHLRSHVGEKTYICSQCPEAFKYLTELRTHASKHYKEQQQQELEEPPQKYQKEVAATATVVAAPTNS